MIGGTILHSRAFDQCQEELPSRAPRSSRRSYHARLMFLDIPPGWRVPPKSSPSAQTRPTRSRTRPSTSATLRQTTRTSATRDSTKMGWISWRGTLSSRCRQEKRGNEVRSRNSRAGRRMLDIRQTQDAMRCNTVIHGSDCLVHCTLYSRRLTIDLSHVHLLVVIITPLVLSGTALTLEASLPRTETQ